jgi:hypothetical protein
LAEVREEREKKLSLSEILRAEKFRNQSTESGFAKRIMTSRIVPREAKFRLSSPRVLVDTPV